MGNIWNRVIQVNDALHQSERNKLPWSRKKNGKNLLQFFPHFLKAATT